MPVRCTATLMRWLPLTGTVTVVGETPTSHEAPGVMTNVTGVLPAFLRVRTSDVCSPPKSSSGGRKKTPGGIGAACGITWTPVQRSLAPFALTALTAYQYDLPPTSMGPSVQVCVLKP